MAGSAARMAGTGPGSDGCGAGRSVNCARRSATVRACDTIALRVPNSSRSIRPEDRCSPSASIAELRSASPMRMFDGSDPGKAAVTP